MKKTSVTFVLGVLSLCLVIACNPNKKDDVVARSKRSLDQMPTNGLSPSVTDTRLSAAVPTCNNQSVNFDIFPGISGTTDWVVDGASSSEARLIVQIRGYQSQTVRFLFDHNSGQSGSNVREATQYVNLGSTVVIMSAQCVLENYANDENYQYCDKLYVGMWAYNNSCSSTVSTIGQNSNLKYQMGILLDRSDEVNLGIYRVDFGVSSFTEISIDEMIRQLNEKANLN